MSITMIAFIVFGTIVLGLVIFVASSTKNEMLLKRKLNELEEESEYDAYVRRGSRIIEELPLLQRTFYPYLIRFSDLMKKLLPAHKIEEINKKLIVAGNPKNMTANEFLGIQGALIVIVPTLIILVGMLTGKFGGSILLALLGAGFGYLIPNMILNNKIKERQKIILKSLPFTLDLLNISVDAGLGFDSAMDKVATHMDGPIAHEFSVVLSEIRLGKTRKEALKNMIERTEVGELNQFIVAIIQAEKLGVGMGRLLKAQSKSMRLAAKQRAQEQAFKAPIKMLFPMILFIFPAIFVVLLGPAALYLPEMFGGL